MSERLVRFIGWFERTHGIAIEQVYTGKMLLALYTLLAERHFTPGSVVITLHTGGLQGRSPSLGPMPICQKRP